MLLFLDLDGVMIPAKPWKSPEILADGFPAFSQEAVNAVNWLLRGFQVERILLTSSHKANYSVNAWMRMFMARGVDPCTIQCLPENTGKLNRRQEIQNWLEANPPMGRILIIDDDTSLHDLPADLKQRFVQPTSMIGLTLEFLKSQDLPD